ncbi:MAG: hypothetical protein ABXS91_11170, partial [Sulfurimonas sp.]
IDDQITEIQNAPEQERVQLMNRFKLRVANMNQQQREEAITQLQQRMRLQTNQNPEAQQEMQMQQSQDMLQMQNMNQHQTANQFRTQMQGSGSDGGPMKPMMGGH